MPLKLEDLLIPHYVEFPFSYNTKKWKHVYNDVNMKGHFYYYDLKDSLYYNVIKNNDWQLYIDYMSQHPTKKDNVEEEVKNYKTLIKNFDIKRADKILVQRSAGGMYMLLDGTHRLSIMLHKGIIKDEIPDEFLTTRQQMIEEELLKTVGNTMYNGWQSGYIKHGYHTFDLQDIFIKGQRNCNVRLNVFRKYFDFTEANLLDAGCNCGAMEFHLPEINKSIGIDYDEKVINAATKISEILYLQEKCKFVRHDFDKDNILDLTSNPLMQGFQPDVVFLLSLQAWIKDWRFFKYICDLHRPVVFLEGSVDENIFPKDKWKSTLIMPHSFDDCTYNDERTSYVIKPI